MTLVIRLVTPDSSDAALLFLSSRSRNLFIGFWLFFTEVFYFYPCEPMAGVFELFGGNKAKIDQPLVFGMHTVVDAKDHRFFVFCIGNFYPTVEG